MSTRNGSSDVVAAANPRTESPRETIARVLPEEVTEEKIRELIRSAFELMKGTYIADGACSGCGKSKQVKVLIPDLQGTIRALTEWLEQGFGRPGTASAEGGDVVLVVERRWPTNGATVTERAEDSTRRDRPPQAEPVGHGAEETEGPGRAESSESSSRSVTVEEVVPAPHA